MAQVRIGDVAREAGVSLGTVSNALNHPEKVRGDTLAHIKETIDRLGYLPNQSARQLAGGTAKTFGLVLPRLDHGISLQIANGAHVEARKHGYDLLIANAADDDILQDHYLRYFLGASVSGVLVQPMDDAHWKPPVQKAPIPTVYLDVKSDEPGYYVASDNEAQGRIIAEHALSHGVRHIAIIGSVRFSKVAARVRGVKDALHGYDDVKLEVIDSGEWNVAADGFSLGQTLALRPEGERPDFVIGLTDVLAAGAIAGIEAAGLSVPGDIQVAGCDGNPLAWSGSVALTTCAPPGYEIGRKGVQLLMEQIGEREPGRNAKISVRRSDGAVCRQEVVHAFLLDRASTAKVKSEHADPSIGAGVNGTTERDINLGAYL